MAHRSILDVIKEIFKDSDEEKSLKDLYNTLLEMGFEDRGDVTKHAIRGAVHELYKRKYINRVSLGVYKKMDPAQ